MKLNLNNIKNTGFKTPDNYFNTVEDNIINAIKQENSLKTSKQTGFKTPDNYFNTVEDVIINKIDTENKPKVITLFSKRNLIYASSIAAAVLLFFNLSFFDKDISLDTLDFQTVERYILDQGIDSYEIAALLTEDELSNINFEILDNAFNTEFLEDYLLENIEIEYILEQ